VRKEERARKGRESRRTEEKKKKPIPEKEDRLLAEKKGEPNHANHHEEPYFLREGGEGIGHSRREEKPSYHLRAGEKKVVNIG